MIKFVRNNKSNQDVVINILTRTSNRPIGFYNCCQTVKSQNYKNIKHYVSFEEESEFENFEGIYKIKVEKYKGDVLTNPKGYLHAPYNLYCNTLLSRVEEGWVMFLDDDDHLFHDKVIQEIVDEIKKGDVDTLFIWQMRYPNGKVLPPKEHFKNKCIELNNIGSPCFIFHSKYKDFVQWDHWKGSDFRVLQKLYEIIPKKKWLKKVYIQINNYGDIGNRNDIKRSLTNKIIFNKKWFWFLIPKYHVRINSVYIFQLKTYLQYWKSTNSKIKSLFKKHK